MIRIDRKSMLIISVTTGLLIVLFLYFQFGPSSKNGSSSQSLIDDKTLGLLPVKNASTADTSHLGPGVIPPTNSWLSGMVLQKEPKAVFPMPISFLAKETGFEAGLPTTTANPTTIIAPHTPGVSVAIAGASTFKLIRYDGVSATLQYLDASAKPLGDITIAEGSPYVYYVPVVDGELTLTGVGEVNSGSSENYYRYTKDGRLYGVVAQGGSKLAQEGSTITASVKKNDPVTMYALPDTTGDDVLRDLAGNILTGVRVSYGSKDNNQTTEFQYQTSGGKPTAVAAMPYQNVEKSGDLIGSYDTIYGKMNLLRTTNYVTVAEKVEPSSTLDLSKLTDEQTAQLIATLKADASSTKIKNTDSYFAGKELARAANLLTLAEQLGQTEISTQLKGILHDAFDQRLSPEYFYYDETLKGIAATNKAFGSEDFNDHHFHYGYFLYAASILARYDQGFLETNKAYVDLLAADIALYEQSDQFPIRRAYDPYAGHSWAAGLAPFSDGNNQESSSEAINAWNGAALWAQVTGNKELESSSKWMLAFESQAAAKAWRIPEVPAGFTSPLISLNFGGKRDYATFFSNEPSAKLGIQLLPLSPALQHFKADGDKITSLVSSSTTNDNFNVPLGDYMLMYLALGDAPKAQRLITQQANEFIDDGNSRAYMYAWVMSR